MGKEPRTLSTTYQGTGLRRAAPRSRRWADGSLLAACDASGLRFLGDDRELLDPLFELEHRGFLQQQGQHAGGGEYNRGSGERCAPSSTG
jgi:hypothetical protein